MNSEGAHLGGDRRAGPAGGLDEAVAAALVSLAVVPFVELGAAGFAALAVPEAGLLAPGSLPRAVLACAVRRALARLPSRRRHLRRRVPGLERHHASRHHNEP